MDYESLNFFEMCVMKLIKATIRVRMLDDDSYPPHSHSLNVNIMLNLTHRYSTVMIVVDNIHVVPIVYLLVPKKRLFEAP